MIEKVTGIVLAGGNSKRMGKDKAFISLHGKKLIEHSIDLLSALCDKVIISANHSVYEDFKLPVITDVYKSIGPIGGLHACLEKSDTKHNILVSCDMPFINQSLLYGIIEQSNSGNYDIISYTYMNQNEPLFAYYSKDILLKIEKQIKNGNYKMQDLFSICRTKLIPLSGNFLLANLNSPKDIEAGLHNFKWKLPNMVLIAGDGRNVGKTFFACSIIKHLSQINQVVGIKTSPHFHNTNNEFEILKETQHFTIIEEKRSTQKDSSLMLQAGAKKVFFIMSQKQYLDNAFEFIANKLKNCIVVAESGGMNEFIVPGIFFFIKDHTKTIKKHYLQYNPIVVTNLDKKFDFDINNLGFRNNYITKNIR